MSIAAPGDGVMGVHSASLRTPVKTAGFPENQTTFAAARSYQQWKFTYAP
ncbi:hypothetical protein AWB69_03295 [Caballeronia udeis]|uniref:Uncharacterized protein n=1 Tax=Caballeronia udeis TaxID=1232866 RepID=A0A158GUT1_9BURK|nr:hypothetical protein [Caballeronia udeis]SAL35250.1 hypothetical protein AWB69_03295 [Caballeronia udeis]